MLFKHNRTILHPISFVTPPLMTPWNFKVYFVMNQMAWSVKILFKSSVRISLKDCQIVWIAYSWAVADNLKNDFKRQTDRDVDRQIIRGAYFTNTPIFYEIGHISIKSNAAQEPTIIINFWKTSRICRRSKILSGISRRWRYISTEKPVASIGYQKVLFDLSVLSSKIRVLLAFLNKVKIME